MGQLLDDEAEAAILAGKACDKVISKLKPFVSAPEGAEGGFDRIVDGRLQPSRGLMDMRGVVRKQKMAREGGNGRGKRSVGRFFALCFRRHVSAFPQI